MEMRVEIGYDFLLDYVVYVERTLEALEKMTKEHESARKSHMIEEDSDDIDFLTD